MYSFSEMLFIALIAFGAGASIALFVKEFKDDLKAVEEHKKGEVFEPIKLGVEGAKEIKENVYVGNGYDDKELKRLVDTHESVLIFHDKAIELLFLPELDIKDFEITKYDRLKSKEIDLDEFRIGRDRFVKVDNNGYDVDYYLYKKEGY